ncbi:MAG TPA: gamma-glutamyltransferase, partial [Naasia sp.]
VARAIIADEAALDADAGCRSVFLPAGSPLAEGDELRQPELAKTLGLLAEGGPDAFYTGELAERWVAGLSALGSAITLEDAAAAAPSVEDPISLEAFGVEVFTSPPNTQGFSLLRTLRMLATEELGDPLGGDAAVLAKDFAANNRIRSRWLADPDAGIDAAQLLEMPVPPKEGDARAATGDTVGLVAVSDDGWAVSLVQSVYWPFGAAVLEPSTGILFQNRGTSFSLDPAHPAAIAAGRRPPHTLMPVLVDRGGRLAYVLATMGGQAQAQIHTHLLLRLLAGATAAEATSAPRWIVGAQEEGDTARTLSVEPEVDAATRDALLSAGLDLKVLPPDAELGHSNVVVLTGGGYDAASDPRSDGSAVVVPASAAEAP